MNETTETPQRGGELGREECWHLAQRILASQQFSKAPQLRDMLSYLSRRALEDAPESISEYEIACNALHRPSNFNSNDDNIVRVQIRHLRKKLDEYFLHEGQGEVAILTIPKGTYVPRFEARMATGSATVEFEMAADVAIPAGGADMAVAGSRPRMVQVGLAVLLVLVAVLAAVSVTLWSQREALRRTVESNAGAAWPADPLWSKIFAAGQQPSIVVADSCRVVIQDILHLDIPLGDGAPGEFPDTLLQGVTDRGLQTALRLISTRQYTSVADLTLTARVVELSQRYKNRPLIKYSRHLDPRDLKTGNFILLGSRRGIPSLRLFEGQLNFEFEADRDTGKYQFRNKAPKAGERDVYRMSDEETYGDIALVPNLSGTGWVLMLSGINMAATEALGELVVSPEFSAALAKLLAAEPGASYVELLVQAKAMAGTARAPRIVAHRYIWPPKP
ncbi:MAG: helix-turn-helix domain-containing protein [Bryobacteraceae bacterium]